MERLFARIGEKARLEDGRTVVFERRKTKARKGRGGSTARHEARHVVGALRNGTGVRFASIVPGPGYLGITELSHFDAVAAMAPHAHGDSGTGHDVSIVKQAGASPDAAASAARSIISPVDAGVEAVAEGLEEAKTLSGGAMEKLMQNAHSVELVVKIFFPNGEKAEKVVNANFSSENEIVEIPRELPKAA